MQGTSSSRVLLEEEEGGLTLPVTESCKPQWLKVEPEGGNESPEKAWAKVETDLCPGGTEKQGMTKWWLVIVTHQKELNLSSASHS